MGRMRHLLLAAFALSVVAALTAASGGATTDKIPIRIGYINDESGPLAVPFVTIGTRVAEKFVNSRGGVGTRKLPIKLVYCAADGSPEKSIDCANKFVTAKVSAVLEGVDLGGDAMLPILKEAKIPLVGGVPFHAGAITDIHSYFFDAAIPAIAAAPLEFFRGQGAKSIVFLMSDSPSNHFFDDQVLVPTAKALGIKYKTVFFNAQSPQWQVLAATAMSENPDVIGSPNTADPDCVGFFNALKSAGYGKSIFIASCGAAARQLGGAAQNAVMYSQFWWPGTPQDAPKAKASEIRNYVAAMRAARQEKWTLSNAAFGFANLVTLSRILGSVKGSHTGPTVEAALRGTKNLDAFLGSRITCDHTAFTGQSACSSGLLFYKVDAKGGLRLASKGWVHPPVPGK
jgi:branched-chain amino acid transport system substrate-binding protein